MSNVFFIGDPHFGHTNITKFRDQFKTCSQHDQYILDSINKRVGSKDLVFFMGDVAFKHESLRTSCEELACRKRLILGNHDNLPIESYLEFFESVHGLVKYKGYWLSHAPIHPQELYGRTNIHGHCHKGGPDGIHYSLQGRGVEAGVPATYINVCAELLPTPYHPISLDEVNDLRRKILGQERANL
jgi:calcineurin-like phosphoesterase family protein